MKKYILFYVIVLSFNILRAQTWTWDSLVTSNGTISLVKDHKDHVYTANGSALVKYNSSGNLLWHKLFPVNNVVCGNDNSLYVSGTFYGTVSIDSQTLTSTGSTDIFVAKLSESGALLWLRQISGKASEQVSDICLNKTNKLLITGTTSDTTNFSGTIIPKAGTRDLFIARYDLIGNFETAFFASFISSTDSYGGSSGFEIEVDNNNDILLLAGIHGKLQIDTVVFDDYYSSYFLKLDTNFRIKWGIRSEGGYSISVGNLKVNSLNELIYTVNENWHYVYYGKLKKRSPNGIYTATYFHEKLGHMYGIDIDSLDNIYFAGHSSRVYSWGGSPPSKYFMHYGKMDVLGNMDWLVVDSSHCGRTGLNIAALNSNFFVAGEFGDSILLFNNYSGVGPNRFLATMNMNNFTNIAVHSGKAMIADYTIFPNPSDNQFILQPNEGLQKKARYGDIILVFDQSGNCVLRQQFSNSGAQQIDISKMAKGIYFVEVDIGTERLYKKVVTN